jgi:hypothetical protein
MKSEVLMERSINYLISCSGKLMRYTRKNMKNLFKSLSGIEIMDKRIRNNKQFFVVVLSDSSLLDNKGQVKKQCD